MESSYFVHPTADVAAGACIGENTKIWHHSQVREGAVVGRGCIVGKSVYIDSGVRVGNNVKIQNGVLIYHGVTLEDGVFCGPHCVFTNDRRPRAINVDGTLKSSDDWTASQTHVCVGASIGAQATIVCGVTIGRWAMVGAGAVVTRDVPDYGLVYGIPARLRGFVCPCGGKLAAGAGGATCGAEGVPMVCPECQAEFLIPETSYACLASAASH